ncbi:electron transfer flavoprotein subunit beta/FixA family protein [Salipaludibacillus sp. CUR1]|uniref:Electron transfer flavoprotein subunit beta n=1 Tax=Salipaludibacillus aurantiacus TaxID=1601833 RepID=A0A1H9T1F4_9BACI|nr:MULTISPECIES: electron transfer flavoprotein subunit beta/FixA family protein [Salipaludibacillus]MCE7793421.1 electron transfer flavoprotein subunit beta/FixA family protein [Salipaludibacillus sp. CUR1]SER90834.1 electron transfer flavoprotein beta subunit [Salipaludibacillus aurantiacus]
MNIYVIMKRTFDTEEKIQIDSGEIVEDGAEFIINPYDEYAIEEAIQLRDEHGGEVTLVSVGDEEAEKQIRTGLAMGADKAVLIEDEDVENGDQFSTEAILAAYFKDQEADIILGGNIAVDGGSGQVGPRLAENLGINHVTSIVNIEIEDGKAKIERDVEGDQEFIEISLPLLVTAQQGLNEPRYPSLPGIMKAKKKPLETLDLDDLDLDEDEVEGKTNTVERYLPPEKEAGKILEGEIDDQVNELVSLLKNEAKVI